MTTAIEVHDVWKKFVVRHNRSYALKIKFLSLFYPRLRETKENFWALRGVTFSVKKGEALGLIGPNGAGKSTLLYLLARTLYPTQGSIRVNGLVSPMIELGLGFSPDLSGLENIFLNMSLYGLSRKEIMQRIDAIVEFSEIQEFIDSPIKNYSTGMAARLGFSVAIHMDPEILLLDEVFAVGDASFQQKCVLKMRELREKNKTIVFVSHTMPSIRLLCDRAALLKNGEITAIGAVDEVIANYESIMQK